MAKKIYKSGGCQPSINVIMKNGKKFHVSFQPHTSGGSVFITDNEDLQWGLEHHSRYGTLYKGEILVEKEAPKPVVETAPEVSQVQVKYVDSVEEAVEYIATNFGVSRSKLKTPAAILKAADKNGVKFEGCAALA